MSIDIRPLQPALAAFERAAYSTSAQGAVDAGLAFCEVLQNAQSVRAHVELPSSLLEQLATRACAAWVACLAREELELNHAQVAGLATHRYTLDCLFAASGFGSSRLLLEVLGQRGAGDEVSYSARSMLKLAAVLSTEHIPLPIVELSLSQPNQQMRAVLAMGWLGQCQYFSEKSEKLVNQLLEQHARFTSDLSTVPNLLLLRVWMGCSYATTPKKHAIKAAIGAELAARTPRFQAAPTRARPDGKPVLLVLAEALNSMHPVYRCYAPMLRQLRASFHTVLLCQHLLHDEATRELFDEVIGEMGQPDAFNRVMPLLGQLSADVAFFPAVGMTDWGIALANQRIARIQVMALGHPASTQSPHMDYAVMPSAFAPAADAFSERVVLMAGDLAHEPYPGLPDELPRSRHEDDDVVRIALNSTYLKLVPSFLSVCREIAKRAKKRVEFRVFPSRHALFHLGYKRQIERQLPGCIVYEAVAYLDHLNNLSQCQVSLAAFPFGNSNSTVDAFLVGVPVVAMVGNEPHGLTDSRKFEPFGLPDWLLAHDQESYIEAAVRIIDDLPERQRVAGLLGVQQVRAAVYGERGAAKRMTDLAGTMGMLLKAHERIQASSLRVIEASQLPAWC